MIVQSSWKAKLSKLYKSWICRQNVASGRRSLAPLTDRTKNAEKMEPNLIKTKDLNDNVLSSSVFVRAPYEATYFIDESRSFIRGKKNIPPR